MLKNVQSIDLTEGKQKRDFIYIDDVVDVYVLLLEKYKNFKSFTDLDVGTGSQIELKEFILKIYNEVKKIKNINTQLNFGALPYREGEFMEINENVKPLYELGWKPKTSLDEGIKNTIKGIYND